MSKLNQLDVLKNCDNYSQDNPTLVYLESLACTYLEYIEQTDCSTTCTIDGKPILDDSVSKCMNTTILANPNEQIEDTRPAHLYFNRNLPDVYTTTPLTDFHKDLPTRIIYCASWSELSEKMKLDPKTICFHVNELQHSSAVEIVNMVNTLVKLLNNKNDTTVSVGIDSDTDYNLIKDLQKSNIFGIIPSTVSFGSEETIKGLQAQWHHIPYWPKHIIEKLPGYKQKKSSSIKPGEIKLTPRQQQILTLIKERGASNKVIAKTLNITESTVKLHVGIVLKKFGVKNRTQLALFS